MAGYRRSGWEEDLGAGIAMLVILGLLLAAAAAFTLLEATGKELGRLGKNSTSYSNRTRRIIGWTILAVVGIVALCALVSLALPAAVTGSVYAAAWGFLALVLVVEGCDWYERHQNRVGAGDLGHLDTY